MYFGMERDMKLGFQGSDKKVLLCFALWQKLGWKSRKRNWVITRKSWKGYHSLPTFCHIIKISSLFWLYTWQPDFFWPFFRIRPLKLIILQHQLVQLCKHSQMESFHLHLYHSIPWLILIVFQLKLKKNLNWKVPENRNRKLCKAV